MTEVFPEEKQKRRRAKTRGPVSDSRGSRHSGSGRQTDVGERWTLRDGEGGHCSLSESGTPDLLLL